jgi:hypothetical protein
VTVAGIDADLFSRRLIWVIGGVLLFSVLLLMVVSGRSPFRSRPPS